MQRVLYLIIYILIGQVLHAQETLTVDSIIAEGIDSIQAVDATNVMEATLQTTAVEKTSKKARRDYSTWAPDPQKALWLALVLPGGGQIYNRKYWKLPIIYGGFVGCAYAMSWNNQMYKDYSQAYLDLMDDDPNTQSYNTFLHMGRQIDQSNEEYYKNVFKKRKDYFRRYRDLSFFCLIGVYALSVIDAYVDAQLSLFDISKDLSLKVRPTTIKNQDMYAQRNPFGNTTLGAQLYIDF